METLTPAQRIVVTIVVVALTLIVVALLLPLLNRTLESWLQGQDSASPTPAASPTVTVAGSTSSTYLMPPPSKDRGANGGVPGLA
jgi:ABC-type phosphate transport system substrate-binding protein